MDERLVVGYDGSTDAQVAVCWAAAEAVRRGWRLEVVHAWGVLEHERAASVGVHPGPALLEQEQSVADEGATLARAAVPAVEVRALAACGSPQAVLVDRGHDARMVVLGRHGAGRLSRALLGSVATGVLHRARCPVAVVPRDISREDSPGPVVVGFDGSPSAFGALDTAREHALAHGTTLAVVTAWTTTPDVLSPSYWVSAYPSRSPAEVAIADAERVARQAEAWAVRADVPVVLDVSEGSPADVLVERSRYASVAVVGSRGRGALRGAMLGSTSHALVLRALCPVLVTRHRVAPAPASGSADRQGAVAV